MLRMMKTTSEKLVSFTNIVAHLNLITIENNLYALTIDLTRPRTPIFIMTNFKVSFLGSYALFFSRSLPKLPFQAFELFLCRQLSFDTANFYPSLGMNL